MLLNDYFQPSPPMPVDRASISTRIKLDPDFAAAATPDQLTLPPRFRSFVVKVHCFAERHGDRDVPVKLIHVDSYGGIELRVTHHAAWMIEKITFNPGQLVFGHNGRALTEEDFQKALSILLKFVTVLLKDPADFIHVIPGISPDSRAWWTSLEIPFQIADPDGCLLQAFMNAKHPGIRKPALRCVGQSISWRSSTGDLAIKIYRKDIEMVARKGEDKVAEPVPVLRIEVTLRRGKLLKAFRGQGVIKLIDDVPKVVGFSAGNLIAVHRMQLSGMRGWSSVTSAAGDDAENKIGRMMGFVAQRTDLTVEDQLDYHELRFGLSANTRCRLRKGADAELAKLTPFDVDKVLSDAAWLCQPSVVVPDAERLTEGRHRCLDIHPLVAAAYGNAKPLTAAANAPA